MFYTRTGRTAACVGVERARVSVTRHACACVLVCVFLCPRTVPQLSLNKFRAPLGNRGLVLGLNMSYFFRSLGTSNGARAEQTQQSSGSRRHNYVFSWVFSWDNHRLIFLKHFGAAMFCLLTKVLFTALCALLYVFFTQQAVFWVTETGWLV